MTCLNAGLSLIVICQTCFHQPIVVHVPNLRRDFSLSECGELWDRNELKLLSKKYSYWDTANQSWTSLRGTRKLQWHVDGTTWILRHDGAFTTGYWFDRAGLAISCRDLTIIDPASKGFRL